MGLNKCRSLVLPFFVLWVFSGSLMAEEADQSVLTEAEQAKIEAIARATARAVLDSQEQAAAAAVEESRIAAIAQRWIDVGESSKKRAVMADRVYSVDSGLGTFAETNADFNSPFSLAGVTDGIFGSGRSITDDRVAFNMNFDLGDDGDKGTIKLQLAYARNSNVLDGIVAAVPSAERQVFKSTVNADLNWTDDATYTVQYDFKRGLFCGDGNDPRARCRGENARSKALFGVNRADLNTAIQLSDKSKVNLQSIVNGTMTLDQKSALASVNAGLNMLSKNSDDKDLPRLYARMFESGSKLYFTASSNQRSKLIGPDSVSVAMTFEYAFRVSQKKLQEKVTAMSTECASLVGIQDQPMCAYGAMAHGLTEMEDEINADHRFTFSLMYKDFDDLEVGDLPGGAFFSEKGFNTTIISAAYSRQFPNAKVLGNSQLAFEYKFEDVEEDKNRNDRSIATLALTKVFKDRPGFSLPFTLVYSNKPEYVQMESDSGLSAHLGLKWALTPK